MIWFGGIAAGFMLLKNAAIRDALRDKHNIKAIEMESTGAATAAERRDKKIFTVRGICDYCDQFKNDDWQAYAAGIASAFAVAIIDNIPEEWR